MPDAGTRTLLVASMPIADVLIVHGPSEPLADGLAGRLADALGAALGTPSGRLWVRLSGLPASRYAENGAALEAGEWPVFVTLLMHQPPPTAARAAHARRTADAVAGALARPVERVHVEYAPAARGRVAFGGQLLE